MVRLQYGETGLDLELDGLNTTVINPVFVETLKDETSAFQEAVRNPISSRPLSELISSDEKVAVVIADITRALPSKRLLPWLFSELSHVHHERFKIIVGTGSHRTNSLDELKGLVGENVLKNYEIINHDSHDASTLAFAGDSPFGYPVHLNREYIEADRRIILGFIEPHFMAGFSGGYKAVFPGVAGIEAIMHYHGFENIANPKSTWGVIEGNPTQATIQTNGSLVPVDFCINVTLNRKQGITRFFCGDPIAAHLAGCRYVKNTAMIACKTSYPIVVTTNSGAPLDLNLYQSVKGMSAGAEILQPGGLVLIATRCNDGIPEHGNFKKLLFENDSIVEIMDKLRIPGSHIYDQWQVQMLAQILEKGRVSIYSELSPKDVQKTFLTPISDLKSALEDELNEIGRDSPIAILPEGPQTIPYLN
ncbi:MAG: Lactate racemase [Candidatus Moanabacter tarae]|uniref:Lactate racemase n=1 Tax=Candidatus Moanibacter tarae TaxID=2200854 RepID=A0A2Z4AGK0_9BACT|nr:MAG: Lactate racemase [Candidatus Moanabacter tarae]|tara:strand:+ start:6026 stop:7285 length:1260 start_codon:yes stop_codon:yes gene_type:complete